MGTGNTLYLDSVKDFACSQTLVDLVPMLRRGNAERGAPAPHDRRAVKPVSHAGALIIIHKWLKPVIPAWTAGIQSQGGESVGWCVA